MKPTQILKTALFTTSLALTPLLVSCDDDNNPSSSNTGGGESTNGGEESGNGSGETTTNPSATNIEVGGIFKITVEDYTSAFTVTSVNTQGTIASGNGNIDLNGDSRFIMENLEFTYDSEDGSFEINDNRLTDNQITATLVDLTSDGGSAQDELQQLINNDTEDNFDRFIEAVFLGSNGQILIEYIEEAEDEDGFIARSFKFENSTLRISGPLVLGNDFELGSNFESVPDPAELTYTAP